MQRSTMSTVSRTSCRIDEWRRACRGLVRNLVSITCAHTRDSVVRCFYTSSETCYSKASRGSKVDLCTSSPSSNPSRPTVVARPLIWPSLVYTTSSLLTSFLKLSFQIRHEVEERKKSRWGGEDGTPDLSITSPDRRLQTHYSYRSRTEKPRFPFKHIGKPRLPK